MELLNDSAVKNLRKYLQIPSVHPNIDYTDCVKFLRDLSNDIGLHFEVIYTKPEKPIVLLTWKGIKPNLPSIFLNSHMDVVPVFDERWTHKPFAADIENGKLYARGSQDMKCLGIMYLEAIRRLKLKRISCLRNVHVCFVPDEEIGGREGMKLFVQTEEFKKLNVGVSLDESCPGERDEFILFYGEKSTWQFTITCRGTSGHGSLLLDNTPAEKVAHILNEVYIFRESQKELMVKNQNLKVCDITTINCTKIEGGIQNNVIPSEMKVTLDCRVAIPYCFDDLEQMINKWCEMSPDCSIEYHQKDPKADKTTLNNSNIYWKSFKETTDNLGLKIAPQLCFGSTDSRYLRQLGIPAFGFTPMNNTPQLMHQNDEYIYINQFVNGIEIFCELIKNLARLE